MPPPRSSRSSATAAVVRQIPNDGRIPSRGSAPASASWASRRELSQRAFDPQAASIASRHRRAGPRSSTSTFAGPPNITPHRKERTMTPRGRFGNSVSCASMASPSPGGAVRAARVLHARRRGIGSACSSTASGPSAGRAGSPAPAARQACVDTRPRRVAVKSRHTYIGDPAVADAALDRVVHDAHQMRKKRTTLTNATDSAT